MAPIFKSKNCAYCRISQQKNKQTSKTRKGSILK